MKFECGDLNRALEQPDLMPEAREHLKHCAACRREYRLWNEISTAARELHEEWESPELWPAIRQTLEAQQKQKGRPAWWRDWRTWSVAATLLLAAGLWLLWPRQHVNDLPRLPNSSSANAPSGAGRAFLTEQALQEVEKTEAAYRASIDRLSQLAQSELKDSRSAVVVNDREKLLLLDSAISETRANLNHNRFNVRLQTELAELYREKQQTLQEVLTRDHKN